MKDVTLSPNDQGASSTVGQQRDPYVVHARQGDSNALEQLLVKTAVPTFLNLARRYRFRLDLLRPTYDQDDFIQDCSALLVMAFTDNDDRSTVFRGDTRASFALFARRLAQRQLIRVERRYNALRRDGSQNRVSLDTLLERWSPDSLQSPCDAIAVVSAYCAWWKANKREKYTASYQLLLFRKRSIYFKHSPCKIPAR